VTIDAPRAASSQRRHIAPSRVLPILVAFMTGAVVAALAKNKPIRDTAMRSTTPSTCVTATPDEPSPDD
jgi:hypothetical protein